MRNARISTGPVIGQVIRPGAIARVHVTSIFARVLLPGYLYSGTAETEKEQSYGLPVTLGRQGRPEVVCGLVKTCPVPGRKPFK